MRFIPITKQNRDAVNTFLSERWFSTDMVIHGEVVDLSRAEGFLLANADRDIRAMATYREKGCALEITSLDSLEENRGVATALIHAVAAEAVIRGKDRLLVVSTNDNLRAIRFYKHRGFTIRQIRKNALDESRALKPEIPLRGENGIPLLHEIELELLLKQSEG